MSPDTEKSLDAKDEVTIPEVPLHRGFPWRRLIFGIAILVIGFALGFATVITFPRHVFHLMRPRSGPPPHRPPLGERLAEKIDLRADQQARFTEIYNKHWNLMLKAAQSQAPQIQSELKALEKEVAEMLDDSQKAKWEEAAARMRFFAPIRLTIEANRQYEPDDGAGGPPPDKPHGMWPGPRKNGPGNGPGKDGPRKERMR